MATRCTELAELVETAALQIVGALGAACEEGLSVPQLTELLGVVLRKRNQIEAAVTRTIGALDLAAEQAREAGELTGGLACATWLAWQLHISSSAAHAQVRLARQLPSMPATMAAFERGELSPQHAGVISRSVERVARGGADARVAEQILLHEADKRDPRDLLRYGLSLLHRLAPQEMEAEEERRHRHRFLRVAEVFDGGYQLEGVWPGCDRPPEQTEGDHIEPWVLGGKTDIENMRSLCGLCRRRLTRGWRLERLPDRRYAVHPPRAPGQPVLRRLSALGAGTRF